MSAEAMDTCDMLMRAYIALLTVYFLYRVTASNEFKEEHGYLPLKYYGYIAATIVTAIATVYISWRL